MVSISMTLRMEVTIPTWLWKSSEMWLLSAFYHRLVKVATFKKVTFLNMTRHWLFTVPQDHSVSVVRKDKQNSCCLSLKRKVLSVDYNFGACIILVSTVTCRAVKVTFKQECLLSNWFPGLPEARRNNCIYCLLNLWMLLWGRMTNLLFIFAHLNRREWRWEAEWSDAGGVEV